ncbi:MAG: hypothetical protein V4662_17785 [Verrucomicrobiota bacterium]
MKHPDAVTPWWLRCILILLFLVSAFFLARYSNPYSPYSERQRAATGGR